MLEAAAILAVNKGFDFFQVGDITQRLQQVIKATYHQHA
jgi:hypothetical protein